MAHPKMGEEQIYQILRSAIFNADLPPGTQLVESALGEAFGVSRTPIRAVLQRLRYESLVQVIPNRGSFVYCPTPEEAEHIFAVRQLLEPEATRLAAIHATPEECRTMLSLVEQEKEWYMRNEPHRAQQVIADFHIAVVEASRNPYLIRYLREIISLTHIVFTFYDVSDANTLHSYQEHYALYEAIRSGDSERAKKMAHDHVPFMMRDIDFTKKLNRPLSIEQIIMRYTP